MSSITTVLKKVYKEGLEPKGFVQLKGRHPYFVRVIGGEIVQVITFRKEPGPVSLREENYVYDHPELSKFCIYGGIATVYRNEIDLSINPRDNFSWLNSQGEMYVKGHKQNIDEDFMHSISEYVFRNEDEHSMYEAAKKSLEMTYQVFLSIFDNISNIEECIKFFEVYNPSTMYLYDKREYGWDDIRFGTSTDNEGLLYILTKNNDNFIVQTKKKCDDWYAVCNNPSSHFTTNDYEEFCKQVEKERLELIKIRDRILSTGDIYFNALKEMERRKSANVERLKSYGLNWEE